MPPSTPHTRCAALRVNIRKESISIQGKILAS